MSPSTMTTHRASAVGSPGEPPAGSDLRSGVPSTPAAAGRARRRWAIALACVSALVAVRPSHAAGTYYVDASSPSCSKSGPGTATQPYCSITSATNAHKGAGITIIVRPGVYPEQVTVPASGSSASPFVLQAQGGTVVVDGADHFGAASQWVLYSGDVWLAASVNWSPLQVFADGARLAASGASPASLPAGTFRWVSKQGLYVNVGGGNPGDHQARVRHRTYGFVLSGRSYVTLDGFTVTRTEDRTIYLSSCSNCTITHNTVNFANKYGIEVKGG